MAATAIRGRVAAAMCAGEAHREFIAAQRERRKLRVAKMLVSPGSAPDRSAASDDAPGRVEAGVLAEIAALGQHTQPGIEQAALTLARLLDNAQAFNHWASAAKQLNALLESLRKRSSTGGVRLKAVTALSARGTPDTG